MVGVGACVNENAGMCVFVFVSVSVSASSGEGGAVCVNAKFVSALDSVGFDTGADVDAGANARAARLPKHFCARALSAEAAPPPPSSSSSTVGADLRKAAHEVKISDEERDAVGIRF